MREIKCSAWYGGKMVEVGQVDFFTDDAFHINGEIVGGVFDNPKVALPHTDVGGECKNPARFELEFAGFRV